MVNKKFWATTFTLTGTIIGAGILGLPYVFSRAGFLAGLFWLILLGIIMLIANLYLGEITLSTKGIHQLPGYAKKYLGKTSEKLMFFAMVFGVYSALLAYLIGEGQSFSQILPGNINPIILGAGFWFAMTILLRDGLKGLKKIETWGVLAIIAIIIGLFFWFAPHITLSNFSRINTSNMFLPFGVIMFALLGFTSIPELRREINGQEKKLKKAIVIGSLIPIILYIIFSFIVVGVLGKNISEVATLSFNKPIILLGIFTMLTSYFVLSFSLKDMFQYDLKLSKKSQFFWISLFPLLLYLVVSIFNIAGFIKILGIGGAISGGLTGILILLINKKSKKEKTRKPEYKIPINWAVIGVISIIFILGIIIEMLF